MAVLGRSRSGAPPDQILDPPLQFSNKNEDFRSKRTFKTFRLVDNTEKD